MNVRCWFGRHPWTYDTSVLDALGRPIRRVCSVCGVQQERAYSAFSVGGHGPWETVRR
jgi:hypothetical protein